MSLQVAQRKGLTVAATGALPYLAYKVATSFSLRMGLGALVGAFGAAFVAHTREPVLLVPVAALNLAMGLEGIVAGGAAATVVYAYVKKVEILKNTLDTLKEFSALEWVVISAAATAGHVAAGPTGAIAASTLTAFLSGS